MKTLVLSVNKFASKPLILSFIIVVSVMFSTVSVSVAEFEVGTQFGITRLSPADEDNSSNVLILQVPSGEISGAGASPYLTFFPHKQLAISPAFNLQRIASTDWWGDSNSVTALYFGSKFYYFFLGHAVSNPYLFGKGSIGIIDDESILSAGIGAGYQWYIAPVYFFRLEGQYHRVLADDENTNVFSLMMGFGVRFGNSKK